ncbi:hypothetical protein KBC03_04295 [Patescibacteria group bacterium]|nr:hypothetical protein [Patescibacteria group bacterium]
MADRGLSNEEKAYYRKRFGRNILQLFAGTVLLLFAYIHLQGNTAEKMSISSGVQVLSQKVQLWFHNLFAKNGGAYQDKLNMEKNYGEVINVVENSSCKEKVDAPALVAKYKDLQDDDVSTYVKKSADYNKFLVDFYRKITDVCKAEVHTQL